MKLKPIRPGSAENLISVARASSGIPSRACVAASHPTTGVAKEGVRYSV
jgi:hypothetical protein